MDEEKPKRVGYKLASGKWVVVPALPIIHAKLPIPGNVTRPDGKVVYIDYVPEDAEVSGA